MPKDDKNICPGITYISVDDLDGLISTEDEERILSFENSWPYKDINCCKSILEEYKNNYNKEDEPVELTFDSSSEKLLSIYSGFYSVDRTHKEYIFELDLKYKILFRFNLNKTILEKNIELFEEYLIYSKNFQTVLNKSVIINILNVATDESIKIAIDNKYLAVYDSKKSEWSDFFEIG